MLNRGIIVPIMGIDNMEDIALFLFGKTRCAVLAFLYSQSDESFYMHHILRAVGTGSGAVQRELKHLTGANIIIREQRGRQVYYRANKKCPVFDELRKIVSGETRQGTPVPGAVVTAEINVPRGEPVARNRNITVPKARVAEFCQRNHIRTLFLFGSVLRQDFRPDSDIDVLVEFESGHVAGLFGIFDMEQELSRIFGGRKIDIRTPKDLSRYFREEILATAELHYAQE